jgi:hypothetical protein
MIERREHLRFTTETREAIGIVCHGGQEHLDRDVAIQLGVPRAVDLAHPAGAERGNDFIRAETLSGDKVHRYFFSSVGQLRRTLMDGSVRRTTALTMNRWPSAVTS